MVVPLAEFASGCFAEQEQYHRLAAAVSWLVEKVTAAENGLVRSRIGLGRHAPTSN